ncbi:unnamed protein product [Lupinus luteus]|uniref:Uncharacterized protein n=1 Tax=Lupinus luteus TaxID=3873 RepID=A0AAV1YIH6_LUPLU
MRFFLEFVSCCGSPTQNRSAPATLPAEDEQRWLVPAPPVIASRPRTRRKRGRRGHEWRPSLGSISEDITVSTRDRTDPRKDTAVVPSTRDVKRRSSGGAGAARGRQRSYNDRDYREPYLLLPVLLSCASSSCIRNLNLKEPTSFDLSHRRDNWRRPKGVIIPLPL